MGERIVVGGSIAALVAADALRESGEQVRLLLPERGVGSGFAAIPHDGRELELGVRLLELSYDGDPDQVPPLREYEPGVGAHRPYAPVVERWVRELLGDRIVEVERPRMFFDGRLVDDLYFTTDASALREALTSEERAVIGAESQRARDAVGDAGLLAPSRAAELAAISAGEASRRNHGLTFHGRLIAPVADKLVAGGADRVLATHRRKIWIPLFWPATLVQACGDGDISFSPSRPFHTVTPNGCGGLLDALMERLRSRGVELEVAGRLERLSRGTAGAVELQFSVAGPISAERPVLGSPPEELFPAAGAEFAPERARSVICWVEARPEDLRWTPSLLNIVDPDVPALRVSSGGHGAPGTQLLTVELRHDLPEAEIAAAALSSLAQAGLVDPGSDLHVVRSAAASTFTLPTEVARDAFSEAQSALLALEPNAELAGGAAGFGADALGEQIIQGLRAAEAILS